MTVYPLYLSKTELSIIVDAITHAQQHEPRLQEQEAFNSAKEKAQTLWRVAEYVEVADEAERRYINLTENEEVYELYSD